MQNDVLIIVPTSTLLASASSCQIDNIISLVDGFELRPFAMTHYDIATIVDKFADRVMLFHSDAPHQIVHPFDRTVLDSIGVALSCYANISRVSFHCASNCDAPRIIDRRYVSGGTVRSRNEMIDAALNNVQMLRSEFGAAFDIDIENNNYYPTDEGCANPYDNVTDASFISDIINACDASLLFDLAHARVTCHNRKASIDDYVNMLPMKRVRQLHLCDHAIDATGMAYDAHDAPSLSTVRCAIDIARSSTRSPLYAIIEYYRDCDKLIDVLKQIKVFLRSEHV